MHTVGMRSGCAVLLIALLLGCRARQPESGWDYRPASGAFEPVISYRFADADGTTFIGSCDGEPSFIVAQGDWDGPEFTLTADGRSWRFHTAQGEDGHYLSVDGYEANHAIATARAFVRFQVGNWRRDIRPSEPFRKFVEDCA